MSYRSAHRNLTHSSSSSSAAGSSALMRNMHSSRKKKNDQEKNNKDKNETDSKNKNNNNKRQRNRDSVSSSSQQRQDRKSTTRNSSTSYSLKNGLIVAGLAGLAGFGAWTLWNRNKETTSESTGFVDPTNEQKARAKTLNGSTDSASDSASASASSVSASSVGVVQELDALIEAFLDKAKTREITCCDLAEMYEVYNTRGKVQWNLDEAQLEDYISVRVKSSSKIKWWTKLGLQSKVQEFQNNGSVCLHAPRVVPLNPMDRLDLFDPS